MKSSGILVFMVIAISLLSCKTEEIILHGDITGLVTDASNNEPIEAASVKLNNTNDTTSTGNDGTYMLKNLVPGQYEIQASKSSFVPSKINVEVVSAKTQVNDFPLDPFPIISVTVLDFGLESTSLSFTISYTGKKKLTYLLTTSQDWISVHPSSGDLTTETDTIKVTINKTGLPEILYEETIKLTSSVSQVTLPDIIIDVYVNGVYDPRSDKHYKAVKIDTQTWMAENLNFGEMRQINGIIADSMLNNGIPEKYCYDNLESNCDIYGGLYMWAEMMQYNPSDNGLTGTTQGVCMDGWHVPTDAEWTILTDYLGGESIAGGKLKEAGTTHWANPNTDATNESGFTGLPGGDLATSCDVDFTRWCFEWKGRNGFWWSSTKGFGIGLSFGNAHVSSEIPNPGASSVRCVKDP
ncbi:MAG: carboxypeptidase regulatory-like domain-containing protein [Bacteroidia bacterium]|nr:carboxypeptidase regulatory-like domain-containing protein [Bacteroidia bacterium]